MEVLARKLQTLAGIRDVDLAVLSAASSDVRTIEPGEDIISEGENPETVFLVLSGFAFRYKLTEEGDRQVFAYLLPGDFCDLHVALLGRMDHSIGTISPCRIAVISRQTIITLTEEHPRIARALWLCNLVDGATLREWLLNIGRRPAHQRLAHLFCEIYARIAAVGLTTPGSFSLPIPQAVLADTVGMSDVHVNRSLRVLREAGLVTFRKQIVSIPNVPELESYAGFDPAYLHLRPPEDRLAFETGAD